MTRRNQWAGQDHIQGSGGQSPVAGAAAGLAATHVAEWVQHQYAQQLQFLFPVQH
jgi:hypothetical protein